MTAYILAAVAFVGLMIYGARSGQLWPELALWDRAARLAGMFFWLTFIAFYWNIGVRHESLMPRQIWITVSTATFTFTQLGGALGRQHHRRKR